jgi:hypothetical protein
MPGRSANYARFVRESGKKITQRIKPAAIHIAGVSMTSETSAGDMSLKIRGNCLTGFEVLRLPGAGNTSPGGIARHR